MPKVTYTKAKGLVQESGNGVNGLLRRQVIALSDAGAATAIRSAITEEESGALFLVPALTTGTQTLALPAPTASLVGCYYDFLAVATLSQIFSLDTDTGDTKIITAEPDGDGTLTVNAAADKFRLTASATKGAGFRITCISTTAAICWHVSNITSGLANGTGEHVAA
jgi:hypothetical protein